MKTKILIATLLICLSHVSAQNKQTVLIKYVHQDNLVSVDYNAILAIDGRRSYYVTAQDSLGDREKLDIPVNNGVTRIVVDDFEYVKKTKEAGYQVYNDLSLPDIYFSHALSLSAPLVFIQEKRPKHEWQLTDETKVIAGFTCKKAIMDFRGRKYTCWYTPEIPVPFGPWKLMGLPGLILEASSEDGAYKVSVISIEFPETETMIPENERGLLTTDKEFLPLQSYIEYQRKFIKFENDHMRLMARKYNIKAIETPESRNYLEIFGN